MNQPLKNLSVLNFIFLISIIATPLLRADYVFEKTICEFFPTDTQPTSPATRLLQGQNGSFYGTTSKGGDHDDGTVFKLTANGSLAVLFSFGETNGSSPSGNLVQTGDGMLYGTTVSGKPDDARLGNGTFFRMTTNGELETLFYFGGTNGSSPAGQLAQGADGFFGTTRFGGNSDFGTLFKITTNGAFTLIHSFNGTNDGCFPSSGLVAANDGYFYGMTSSGGNGLTGFSGYGTIFRFGTNGIFESLVAFDINNASSAKGGLTLGSDGQLYGVAGTQIFSMTTNGVFKTIASFDGTKALNPLGTFLLTSDGNLYAALADEQRNLTLDGNAGAVIRLVEPPTLAVTASSSDVKLTWTSFPEGIYRVDKASSLDSPNWTALSAEIVATGNSVSFTNTLNAETQEFYRVVLLP